MLAFPRWKVWATLLLLAAGVVLAIPSLMGEGNAARFGLARWPHINLGLDLSGGSHLLLEADTNDVVRQRLTDMEDQVRAQMRKTDPAIDIGDISTDGGKLSFPVRDIAQLDAAVERMRSVTQGIGLTGQRDWTVAVVDSTRIVMTPTPNGISRAIDNAMQTATEVVRRRIDALGTKEPTIIRQGNDRIVVQVPGLQNPEALKALIGRTAKLEFKLVDTGANPADTAKGIARPGSQVLPFADKSQGLAAQFLAVQRRAIITGDRLTDAEQGYDQQTNAPDINFKFDGAGGKAFARVTTDNVGKPFAIILDNQVISAPTIQTPILGGQGVITGNFTVDSANQLAISLRSGSLPVTLKTVEERTVGPQLGADSIRAGLIASTIAAVAVIAFMLLTYGRFGVYANLAVVLNLFVILSVMALFGATLTLPGIAGFVLTIGTAVDANVLINERIREERRRGRGIVQAVELGYKESSRTIFEANGTHAIAGLIMLMLGSGPVKGFAVVLLIGIATSVFTAVTFTRMLVILWIRRNKPREMNI